MVNDLTGGTQPQTKTSTAQQETAGVAGDAANAGQHVAGVAKSEASKVVSEAGSQAKDLLSQVQGELKEQAGTQQKRVTEGLQSVGRELNSMADGAENGGVASDLVAQAASRVNDVASWLDGREPGSLLDEVKGFARRRPGVFIAVAAGAGLLAGRLTRAITTDTSSTGTPSTGTSSTGTPSTGTAPTGRTTPVPSAYEPASTIGYESAGTVGGATGYTAAAGYPTPPAVVDGDVAYDADYVEFEPGVDPVTGLRNEGDRL